MFTLYRITFGEDTTSIRYVTLQNAEITVLMCELIFVPAKKLYGTV